MLRPATTPALLLMLCSLVARADTAPESLPDTTGTGDGFAVPAWLYPVPPQAPAQAGATADESLHVPGSDATYTRAQIADRFEVPDWFPDEHPPMPPAVAHGRHPDLNACGYCHLATGAGRPENATLAGLPAAYIVEQLNAFAAGTRKSAFDDAAYLPATRMPQIASVATVAETLDAATYFAALRLGGPRATVVETDRVPKTRPVAWLYEMTSDGDEPLGQRIIEAPRDFERHELRDPRAEYVAYVPPGSVERGRRIALDGSAATPACATCHGPDLRGVGLVPPIAGRSPTYLLRQLVAFRTGARNTPAGAPMTPVAAGLTLDEMISVAAYAATRQP